jgi:8-oxo-dGTP diphosphatase
MTARGRVSTVDLVIETPRGIVLIDRKNPPCGWALPGGFAEDDESLEDAARREGKEETGLDITLVAVLGVYSAPERDRAEHTISVAFVAKADGIPRGGDDARAARIFPLEDVPPLCFDHDEMIADYRAWCRTGRCRAPR